MKHKLLLGPFRGSLWDAHQDLSILDFHAITCDTDAGSIQACPCLDIEVPPMPGTGDDRAIQDTIPERTTSMRANIVNRIKSAVTLKNCDHMTLNLRHTSLSFFYICGIRHTNILHTTVPPILQDSNWMTLIKWYNPLSDLSNRISKHHPVFGSHFTVDNTPITEAR